MVKLFERLDLSPGWSEEERMLLDSVRALATRKVAQRAADCDRDARFPWESVNDINQLALNAMFIPEEYGGPGADPLYNVIVSEELGHYPCGASVGASFTSDIATHLMVHFGTEAQKKEWFPKILSGHAVQCLALTEPGAGSDISGLVTRAKKDGDGFILNGNKTYISNGNIADLMYVVAKTDDFTGPNDMTIFVVDAKKEGVSSRGLKTMGAPLYPVGEIFFDNVRLSRDDILGEEGKGFKVLFSTFAQDRIQIAARSLAAAELAFQLTVDFVKNRKIGNKTVFDFQNTQFKLAEMKTELTVGRDFLNACLKRFVEGSFDLATAAMAKIWLCELEQRVAHECVQLHGGAGYMDEYVISRIYTNARLQTIYAGTTELQKVAIARTI